MKKSTIFLSTLLLISMIVCSGSFIYAANGASLNIIQDEPLEIQKISIGNQTIQLTYQESDVDSLSQQKHLYFDNANNLYKFNTSNDLVSYRISDEQVLSKQNSVIAKSVTDISAKNLADAYLRELYGDDFANYSLSEQKDDGSMYRFCYELIYKDSPKIVGSTITLWMYYDGEIFGHTARGLLDFSKFEPAALNELSESFLYEYALANLSAIYGSDLKSIELDTIEIINKNDSFSLKLAVDVHLQTDEDSYAIGDICYYELLNQK